jgi:hypothetical protein
MSEDQTSIQRFVRNRGSVLLAGTHYGRSGYVAQMTVGAVFTGLGAVMLIGGLVTRTFALEMSCIGPGIAGVTNLIVGSVFHSKVKGKTQSQAKLTPEARTFLSHLSRQILGRSYEWSDPTVAHYSAGWNRRPGVRSGGRLLGVRQRGPQDVLPEPVFELLEQACFQYNRTCGIVELATEGSPAKKLADSAQRAADETILEIIHQAALISRYPESSNAAVQTSQARIAALHELADRLESLQTRHPGLTDRMSSSSAMESVLEELKLDEIVRAELTFRPEERDLRDRA